MTKREAEMKRRAAALPPKPVPPQACSSAEGDLRRDRVNSAPIDLRLLEAERWTGGTFCWNGQPVIIKRARP
jgi:hypothetical protein